MKLWNLKGSFAAINIDFAKLFGMKFLVCNLTNMHRNARANLVLLCFAVRRL